MKLTLCFLVGMLFGALLLSCGGVTTVSGGGCPITASVVPSTAMANHTAAPPGNQVQFSTSFKVNGPGICPLIVTAGSWTTSDPVNTSISNQPATQGLATCLNATPTPATIGYTGEISGQPFTPATLTCE